MEIRVRVDDQFSKQLQDTLGTKKTTEIAKAALTLLNWAATQKTKGRIILSGDENGENLHELALPILDGVKRTKSIVVGKEATEHFSEGQGQNPTGLVRPAAEADRKQVTVFYHSPQTKPSGTP